MDFTAITLNAAAKALHDSVLPTLAESGNRQALEQAHLVYDAITFARDRVDLVSERRRFEAVGLAELVGDLSRHEAVDASTRDRLGTIHTHAENLIADAGTAARDYLDLISELGGGVEAALASVASRDDIRSEVEGMVLDRALERLELDRAWLLPLGFDPEPTGVKDISALLSR